MEARTAASSNVRKRSDTERFRDAAQGRQWAFLAPAQRLALKGDKLSAPSDLAERQRRRAPARRTCTAALAQETEQKARGVRQGVSAIGLAYLRPPRVDDVPLALDVRLGFAGRELG
jgi:hypothetical protein